MNYWTELSIQYANQRNYLDELFKVYPTIPEGIREIDLHKWNAVENAFHEGKSIELIESLLSLDLFPIKDSYIAYLKRDKSAIYRNPRTVARIYSRLQEIGLAGIFEKCTEPKETNRQIGPSFRRWIQKGTLGVPLCDYSSFIHSTHDSVLDGSDGELMQFANQYLSYGGSKGLDFIARINNKYVVGEAKFLTDYGGHQNAQFEDAKNLLTNNSLRALKIAILDGVLYIPGSNKMFNYITQNDGAYNIMSSLVLREFLFQV